MNRRVILFSSFLVLMNFEFITGQTGQGPCELRWYVFSPPDKSFRIEVPDVMRYVKDPEVQWLDGYAAHRLSSGDFQYRYFVGVMNLSPEENPDSLDGLEFLIGGDNRRPTIQVTISVDGWPGKEVIYSPPPEFGVTYFRGRIIDAGKRIFIIKLTSDNREDLHSTSTNRFFNSFHLARKRLKRTRTSNNQ